MSSDNNERLQELLLTERARPLEDEIFRRSVLATSLGELSVAMERNPVTKPIVEPTIFARLYALSQIQRTQLGIAGFNPLDAVSHEGPNHAATAVVMPPHGELHKDDGMNIVKTRMIKFEIPSYYDNTHIDLFGVNVYPPEAQNVVTTQPGIIAIGSSVKLLDDKEPITGETPIFAAVNTRTKDAKIYSVAFKNNTDESPFGPSQMIDHVSAAEVNVTLPDGSVVNIKQLGEADQRLITQEIEKSIRSADDDSSYGENALSKEEVGVARELMSQNGDSERYLD